MQYRTLGNTSLKVSALSFGASSLGGVFREINEDEAIQTVHAAVDGGMNLIDVSPFYGLTKAEMVLGKALREIARDRYYLCTKCGRYGESASDFDFSPKRITASIEESLKRLNVDHVDFFVAHDIEFGHFDSIIQDTIPALDKLKQQGKTRFIGVTGYPLPLLERVLTQLPHGTIDVMVSYCHYALTNTQLPALITKAQAAGVGIINASPTGMGLLTHRGGPAWHPAPKALKEACRKAADYCMKAGQDITRLAMQFAVAEPCVPTTLVSTASPAEIRQNLAWIEQPMDEETLAAVRNILAPVHNLTWPSGLPENYSSC